MLRGVTRNPEIKRPSLEQLLEAAPMLCRASVTLDPDVSPALYAGAPITPEVREELLAKCARNEYVEIDVPLLAYEQWDFEKFPDKDNRNFVCFRDGEMPSLGRSGRRNPFIRDHEQRNALARGGTIVSSDTKTPQEGHRQIFQVARLTAPWAVDAYLRGLMTSVSIGWHPTGPVLCSACNAPVMEKCWHWPGDRLATVTDEDGTKRKVRKRDGAEVVRWIYTKAVLIETSWVLVPGVESAGMDQLRGRLAARFPGCGFDGQPDEDDAAHALAADKSPPSSALRSVDPQPETQAENIQMADQNPDQSKQLGALRKALALALTMPEAHRQHAAGLDDQEREAFLGLSAAERESAVQAALAADPVEFEGKLTGLTIRRSEGAKALQLAKLAEQGAEQNKRNEDALARAAAAAESAEIATLCRSRLAHLPGADAVRENIVRALRKAGDPALLEQSLQSLTAASEFVQRSGKAPGANDGADPVEHAGDALGAWNRGVDEYAKANNITDRGAALERFLGTAKGRELKSAYDATRSYGQTK
jgi:hypothetical protein